MVLSVEEPNERGLPNHTGGEYVATFRIMNRCLFWMSMCPCTSLFETMKNKRKAYQMTLAKYPQEHESLHHDTSTS
jgi:hypothetical protein